MSYEIINADARSLPLKDESVDLIITSPPYFALRSYQDGGEHYEDQIGSEPTPQEFLETLWLVTKECWRVLKPTGSLWVNLGDKYAGSGGANNSNLSAAGARGGPTSYNKNANVRNKSLMGLPWRYAIGLIDSQDWILRAEIIWSKPNGIPESVNDRVRRNHEQWFHFTKQGQYFAAIDEIREAVKGDGQGIVWEDVKDQSVNGKTRGPGIEENPGIGGWQANPLGRLPSSVWSIPSEPLTIPDWAREKYKLPDHFAAFPQEWPRRIILGFSPNGICTKCHEPRRPLIKSEVESTGHTNRRKGSGKRDSIEAQGNDRGFNGSGYPVGRTIASITGYVCACPDDSADTEPAIVLDPFGGTGTVAGVAHVLGRHGISVDLSKDYCRLAEWRIGESGHFQKSIKRSNEDNQGSLL